MNKLVFSVVAIVCAGVVSAADYAWLADPLNGNWLGAANWTTGEWVADASNTAAFDVSSATDVDVNGDVAVSGVTVRNADYTFSNGTLTVNGEFGVGAGATATVRSALLGTNKDRRFAKTGSGTLVVKGDASTTNVFARFATRGGTMVLDGGVTKVTGPSDGPGETAVAGSFANTSRLEITGGAQLLFTASSSYLSNSGCDIVVSDGLFDCWSFNEFLNGFGDNNNTDKAKVGKITIRNKGVLRANQIRIAKVERTASYWTPDYGTINLETGGVLRVRNFSMDGSPSRKTATMNFNGGTLEFVNPAAEVASEYTADTAATESMYPQSISFSAAPTVIIEAKDCAKVFIARIAAALSHVLSILFLLLYVLKYLNPRLMIFEPLLMLVHLAEQLLVRTLLVLLQLLDRRVQYTKGSVKHAERLCQLRYPRRHRADKPRKRDNPNNNFPCHSRHPSIRKRALRYPSPENIRYTSPDHSGSRAYVVFHLFLLLCI